jgi:hypothetical protein
MRRCLILRQGASPLRPPSSRLTGSGLLMEAATVRESVSAEHERIGRMRILTFGLSNSLFHHH